MNIKTKIDDNYFKVIAPYNPEFNIRSRALGGKWAGRFWKFDKNKEKEVRENLFDIFGTDGSDNPLYVDLRIKLIANPSWGSELYIAGRLIAKLVDEGFRLGRGVSFVNSVPDIRPFKKLDNLLFLNGSTVKVAKVPFQIAKRIFRMDVQNVHIHLNGVNIVPGSALERRL